MTPDSTFWLGVCVGGLTLGPLLAFALLFCMGATRVNALTDGRLGPIERSWNTPEEDEAWKNL